MNPPGKGKKGSQGAVSRVISARLNPNEPTGMEKDALAVFDSLVEQGYEPRQIITDALLHAAGRKPAMYSSAKRVDNMVGQLADRLEALDGLNERLDALQTAIQDSVRDMLLELRRSDPEGLREFANADDQVDGGQFSSDFAANAQKAFNPTFKERQAQKRKLK